MVTTLRVYFYYSIRNSLKGDKNTRVQVSKVKGNKIFLKKNRFQEENSTRPARREKSKENRRGDDTIV